jgi:carbon monoxide dehydrogenase subunit G
MRLEKQFDVKRPRAEVIAAVVRDETLIELFPDQETEIVESRGNRRTTLTRYRALGREGEATFHFCFEDDGSIRFEKVCDGRIWRELTGLVSFEERGQGTRVRLALEGRTKALVPEFTVKGQMQAQLEEMSEALRRRIAASGKKKG